MAGFDQGSRSDRQRDRRERYRLLNFAVRFLSLFLLSWSRITCVYADDILAILYIFYCDVSGVCVLLLLLLNKINKSIITLHMRI